MFSLKKGKLRYAVAIYASGEKVAHLPVESNFYKFRAQLYGLNCKLVALGKKGRTHSPLAQLCLEK